MSENSSIEWTDATWSPIRYRVRPDAAAIATAKGYTSLVNIASKMAGHVGQHCEPVSPGCERCYSGTNQARCLPTNGTGLPFDRRSRDLVEAFVDETVLRQPLKWKRGRQIFVENQSDLFGEWIPDEMIDLVLAVMALCPQHTFQVLTKRAGRLREYFSSDSTPTRIMDAMNVGAAALRWPLPNVWLGVSVEDQQRADERIPDLLQTPAAVRFLSAEPLLGTVDLQLYLPWRVNPHWSGRADESPASERGIDWVIVGGESGPGARPCNTEWVAAIVEQCANAGAACFVKQLGGHVIQGGERRRKANRKGSNMDEWPHAIRVRQMPGVVA